MIKKNISMLNSEKCTGCMVCINSCPKKIITIKEDGLGFKYPIIKESLCNNCGICLHKCPELTKMEKIFPDEVYAALWKNKDALDGCSSGGIATMLATNIVLNGGVYYGAVSENDGNINYRRICETDKISFAKGSKYIQSNLEVVYQNILNDLKRTEVLFVGTPCQCAALSRFCEKNMNNLLLVSFPCGGWSSSRILQSEVFFHTGKKSCDKVIMRNRHKVSIDIYDNGKRRTSCAPNDSYFMTALDYKLSVRESCWNCSYCCPERVGDIILGDYWGYEPTRLFSRKEISDGISFVGLITEKGARSFRNLMEQMKIEQTQYNQVIKNNPRLKSRIAEDNHYSMILRKKFVEKYQKQYSIKEAVLAVIPMRHLVRKIRGIIKYRIMNRRD